jgi:hypothetical protein
MLSPHEKVSILLHLERAWQATNGLPTTTPCAACIWDKAGFCKKWDAMIPKDRLATGCEAWEFNRESTPF